MKMMRRIKIGPRLYGMFSLLVIALIIIAYSGVTQRLKQIKDTELLKNNYIGHLEMLAEVNVTTGNLFLSYRNYYLEYPDQEKMQVRLTDINNRTGFILTNLQDYKKSLESQNASVKDIEDISNAIAKIQNEVVPFNEKIIGLVQSEKMDDVHDLIISKELRTLRSTLQDDLITAIYNNCVNNSIAILDENVSEMYASNLRIIIMVVLGFIFVVVFSVLVVRSVVIPVNKLMQASKEISNGNIDANLPPQGNDEVGELTRQFGNVAEVLGNLIGDMSEMAKEHQLGKISARVDESRFNGAYRDVALGVNEMVESYVQHIRDICFVLKEFGAGDFNAGYARLPGEKAVLNDVVEELRKNLKDIHREINTLADAAVEGKLETRANPNKFRGDWTSLLVDLNEVMDAVISPIVESSEVLSAMAAGNLSAKVKGDYKGDFTIIKDSLNSTQNAISSYISEISDILNDVSNQNLNVSIDRQYIGDFSLIKDSINMIVSIFNDILINFNASSAQVAIGSRHISDASQNLSQGASDQASAVEELNASIDLIAAQTNKNADTAQKANRLVADVKKNAEKEAVMMQETLTAMEGINESSANISKIIKVIEDIAFQTNLLALNAAVEAARAGQYGKGFAVVAEEVRSLASRSQNAAKETTELIEGSVQKASNGARVALETAKGLEEILGQISDISGFINTITDASLEQNSNIGQISEGIARISNVSQTNTAISQETAASAEELSSQAELLKETVGRFKLK